MPLWASWLRDFDILNIFYDELKIEKMAKFETLIATNGLRMSHTSAFKSRRHGPTGGTGASVTSDC